MNERRNPSSGTSLESFLEEEGILDEAIAFLSKKLLINQVKKVMRETRVSQSELASRMQTSRAVVQRLLNPECVSFTFLTLHKVARALGKKITVKFNSDESNIHRK